MTASNLAVCFAPSLFHIACASRGNPSSSPKWGHKQTAGLPDQRELLEQKAAQECLTVMINESKKIFMVGHVVVYDQYSGFEAVIHETNCTQILGVWMASVPVSIDLWLMKRWQILCLCLQVPEDMLSKCRLSYVELGDPVPIYDLAKRGSDSSSEADYTAHIESSIQGLLKVGHSPPFKWWYTVKSLEKEHV